MRCFDVARIGEPDVDIEKCRVNFVEFVIEFVFSIDNMSISSSASSCLDDGVVIQEVLAERSSLSGDHICF
jgi:hypothetical protein